MIPRVVRGFLEPAEAALLLEIARASSFYPGRSGAYLHTVVEDPRIIPIAERAFRHIGPFKNHRIHILKYPEGTSVRLHTDDMDCEARRQMISIIQRAELGGTLIIEGTPYPLQALDGIVFEGKTSPHEVTEIVKGERLSLLVACWN